MFSGKSVLKICNKFTGEHPSRIVIEIALLNGCSPVNLLHIFRTLFYKNTYVELLLFITETLLVFHFYIVWACRTMSDHTHLISMNQFASSQDEYLYAKNQTQMWRRGVVIITSAQLHSTKSELRFCAGSKPARGLSVIRNGEDLWQWSRLEIRLNVFCRSTIPQKQFIIIIILLADLTFWSTLSMSNHAPQDPLGNYKSICSFYEFLCTYKKCNLYNKYFKNPAIGKS